MAQSAERIHGAAEVRETEATVEIFERLSEHLCLFQIGCGCVLRVLQDHDFLWEFCCLERDTQPGQEGIVRERRVGEIDGYARVMAVGALLTHLLDGIENDPAVNAPAHARLLRQLDEFVWAQQIPIVVG